jgi:hypothetical protein
MDTLTRVAVAATLLMVASVPAQAVTLNPRGLGQVLIFPYYTVNKGQDTLISVINTSAIGKAVKIRFLEGYNGRNVRSFVVFLSAHDVWTAVVSQLGDQSAARVVTTDHSCTVPPLPAEGEPFTSRWYDGSSEIAADSGPNADTRTREGYIEVVADGDIAVGSLTDQRATQVQDGSPGGGRPAGCDDLTEGGFSGDLIVPTSGLTGSASIVNVGQGTFFAYNADALTGFTGVAFPYGMGAFEPDDLGHANSGSAMSGDVYATIPTDTGSVLTLHYSRAIDAVSAVFMADSINNEFLTSAAIGANTDWIVTFPTKRFYVDPPYAPSAPVKPFSDAFVSGEARVAVDGEIDDHEGLQRLTGRPVGGCGILCLGVPPFRLPYQVNAVTFPLDPTIVAPSGVFGSQLSAVFGPLYGSAPYGDAGWARIGLNPESERHILPGGTTDAGTSIDLNGLPISGFMVYNIVNTQAAPGTLANYGGTFAHRTTTSCVSRGTAPGENDPCS